MTVREGQIINTRYTVEAFLGRGGMSDVYLVHDVERRADLAIKVLHENLVEDQVILKSFRREANALQTLEHPKIVRFYGIEESQDDIFLVEQYIDGPTLKEVLRHRQNQPMGITEALTYLKAISDALGYAHIKGIVHCDMKPANIMVDRDGNIYLTDFGIMRHAESSATDFGGPVGTLAYMAPEQFHDEVVVYPATDIYSVAVMLFELLTGRRPFEGLDPESKTSGRSRAQQIKHAHLEENPPDPRTYNPFIPVELADVILKALEKDALARQKYFPTIRDFYQETCKAAGIDPVQVVERTEIPDWFPPVRRNNQAETPPLPPRKPTPPPVGPTQLKPTPEEDQITQPPPRVKEDHSKRNLLILLGALAVLIIATVLFLPRLLAQPAPTPEPIKIEQPTSAPQEPNSYIINTTEAPPAEVPTEAPTATEEIVPTDTLKPTNTQIPTETNTPAPTLQPVRALPSGCGLPTFLKDLRYAYVDVPVTLFGVPRYSTVSIRNAIAETTPMRDLYQCERLELLPLSSSEMQKQCSRNTYFWHVKTETGEIGWAPEYYVKHDKDEADEKNFLSLEVYYLVPNPPIDCP
jgi:serine/threonine protein kinase